MPKVIAYTALHYGRDYLAYAIQSVIEAIDEYHVLYSAHGSHGTQVGIPCPESRQELYDIARTMAGSKLHWHDGDWRRENEQRESIYQYAPDADVVIVLDADEVWPDGLVEDVLGQTSRHHYRFIRMPLIHFWRSFSRAVLHDPAAPVRVIYPHMPYGEMSIASKLLHFGYAQRPEIVQYKMRIHGHKHELKPNWFETVFMDERRTMDLHPVGSEYWNVETIDPWQYLPDFMKSHPYAKKDVIR